LLSFPQSTTHKKSKIQPTINNNYFQSIVTTKQQ